MYTYMYSIQYNIIQYNKMCRVMSSAFGLGFFANTGSASACAQTAILLKAAPDLDVTFGEDTYAVGVTKDSIDSW